MSSPIREIWPVVLVKRNACSAADSRSGPDLPSTIPAGAESTSSLIGCRALVAGGVALGSMNRLTKPDPSCLPDALATGRLKPDGKVAPRTHSQFAENRLQLTRDGMLARASAFCDVGIS